MDAVFPIIIAKMIKVLIADDQELIRESLKIILGAHDNIEIVGVVGNGYEDIMVIYNGGALINPDIATKVVSMFSNMSRNRNLIINVEENCLDELSKNEWKIVQNIGLGLSNKEIAKKMFLSEGTVRNYLSSILSKLDLRDRTQLAIWAVQTGQIAKDFDND